MKRHFITLTITLILTVLLSFPILSLAQKVPPQGKWDRKADMPTVRSHLSVSVVNNLIYAFGGWDSKLRQRLATVEVYNPATDKWKKLPDMPTGREQFTTNVVDGKVYFFGGVTAVKRRDKIVTKTLATIDVYDPAANAWEQKADAPTARSRFTSAAVDGKIYLLSGTSNVGVGGNLLQIYHPATDTWQQGADLIQRRWGASSAAVNGKVYAFGGWVKPQNMVEVVEEYDPASDTWTRKADQPNARYIAGVHAGVAGGKIYVIGGTNINIDKVQQCVTEYDPAADAWAKRLKMPAPAMVFDAASVGGKIYVIGGVSENKGVVHGGGPLEWWAPDVIQLATIWAYTPPGWPFAVSPKGRLATTWGAIKTTE